MESHSTRIQKAHFRWLASQLGHPSGIFSGIKWNQGNVDLVTREWADIFGLAQLIEKIGWTDRQAFLCSFDRIVLDIYLRSVIRPADGLAPQIIGKPLPNPYEALLKSWEERIEKSI